jgi:hypothetical protein
MRHENREIWKKRIERWAESGRSAREFADDTGVNVHSLRHWKWKLGAETRRDQGQPTPSRKAAFVEILAPVATGGDGALAERASAAEPIELVLAKGLRIRIPERFDATSLRRLLDAVEGR